MLTYEDYESIKRLKSRYFQFIDTKQYDKLLDLFTIDAKYEGLWAQAEDPVAFVEALKRNLPEGTVSIHQGYMPDIVGLSKDTARGIWTMYDYLLWPIGTKKYLGESVENQRGIHGYGHYEEEYIKTNEGWKISFLRLSRLRIDPIVGDEPSMPNYPFVKLLPDWLGN